MPNTSATGGYLSPTSGPLDGVDLRRFVGSVIVGISGFAPQLVIPSWQVNPPPQKPIDVDWIAYGVSELRSDPYPFLRLINDGAESETIKHEEIDYLLSFYGPSCLGNADRFRDGAMLGQNQEALYHNDMAIIGFSPVRHVPEKINELWFDRCDMVMTIRREVRRVYPVMNFTGTDITINNVAV